MSAAHEALGVPVGATAADIRKAYHRLSREHHPDMLPPGASAAERRAAADRFNTINRAYEQLNPEKQQQRERNEQERRQQQKKHADEQQRQRQERERQEQRQGQERQQRERQQRERQQRQGQERQQRERQQRQGQERQGATGSAGFIPLWMRERLAQAAINVGEVVAEQGEAVVRDLGHTGVEKGVDYLRSLFRAKP